MTAAKVSLPDHVSWRKVGDQAVLLNLENSEYYTFNETGGLLLELLSKTATAEELADALCSGFDVARSAAVSDVKRFLSRLKANGLVRE